MASTSTVVLRSFYNTDKVASDTNLSTEIFNKLCKGISREMTFESIQIIDHAKLA